MYQLILGATCIGFAPIFVRLLKMDPTPIGFYRCGIAALVLMFFQFFRRDQIPLPLYRWPRGVWKLLVVGGFLFAADLFVWHRSVIYVGAGISTILANTQVLYVALIGVIFFHEKLTWPFCISIVLAFFGIFLLVGVRNFPLGNAHYMSGILLGLFTGIIYACYLLTLRALERSKRGISSVSLILVVSAISAFFLMVTALTEGSLHLPQGTDWIWLPALAIVSQVCGWLLITKGLSQSSVSRAGLILTLQPIVAILGGVLILGEHLDFSQFMGAGITLLAIFLGQRRT